MINMITERLGCCRFSVKFKYFQLLLITWLGQRAAPVIRAALRGSRKHTRWEGHGVPLDKAPCGLGEAGDPKSRANPANETKDIHKYLEVPLAGKRSSTEVGRCCYGPLRGCLGPSIPAWRRHTHIYQ